MAEAQRYNPIRDIQADLRRELAVQEKTENKSVSTDMHSIAQREARLVNEVFQDKYFDALSVIYENQTSFADLLMDTEPRRWRKIMSEVGQWAAIIAIALILLLGCTSSTPL